MNSSNFFVAMSDIINNLKVYGIYGEDEAWFTRKQIGELLEYESPVNSISMIHNRHKERLDALSKEIHISFPQGGQQDVFVYSLKGVLEICRWSKQPKADMVMDALYDMAEKVLKQGYFSTMSDEELYIFLANKMKENDSTFNGAVAPAIASTGMDIRDAVNKIAFAAGYSEILCRPSAKLADFQIERHRKMELIRLWEEQPYKNHFTYDDIPDWAKEKIKAKGYGPSHDRFPEMFEYLQRRDGNGRWLRNFCEVNKQYHFTRAGYSKIIDYAVKNHMIFKDEADLWRMEAGLPEKIGS